MIEQLPPPWVVVITGEESEDTAERHLRRAGYRVYLPRYRRLLWPHGSERRGLPTLRPLFPGYLFAHDWRGWPQTRVAGVISLLRRPDGRMVEVADADVMLIRRREYSGKFDDVSSPARSARGKRTDISAGDAVGLDLLDSGVEAVVEELTDSGQAIVRTMMFGREARTTVAA